MNNDKMIQFVKRWRALERSRKDLDYMYSVFARDLREECGSDARFVKWCETEIGLTEFQSEELLAKASLVKLVGDEETWKKLGGYRSIQYLTKLGTKREQISAIEAAKNENLQVATVVRQRLAIVAANNPSPDISPAIRPVRAGRLSDADTLARFILANVPSSKITPDIREILRMYVPGKATAA